MDDELHREKTGPRTLFKEGKFDSWTSFPCKQRKFQSTKCSKCLFTVCPRRSIALCLCSPWASPSSFLFSLPRIFFSSANFSCQIISLRAWTSSVCSQVIPVAFSSWCIFALCRKVSLSLMNFFIDFEFRMIKATTAIWFHTFPCPFLASIRMLIAEVP